MSFVIMVSITIRALHIYSYPARTCTQQGRVIKPGIFDYICDRIWENPPYLAVGSKVIFFQKRLLPSLISA